MRAVHAVDAAPGCSPRRVAGIGLLAVLIALALPWASSPASATIAPPEPPPIAVPTALTPPSVPTNGWGGAATELCTRSTSATAGCILLAGVGAYEGTCYVLGQIFHGGSCDGGAGTVISYLFGSGGDSRLTYTGDPAIITRVGALEYRVFRAQSSDRYLIVGYSGGCQLSVYGIGDSITRDLVFDGTPQDDRAALGIAYGLSTSSVGISGDGCSSTSLMPGQSVIKVQVWNNVPTPAVLEAGYAGDPGGDPWTLDYKETCVKGTQSVTAHQASTFTPAAGQASPAITLPACETLLPGSHLDGIDVLGGRAGITAPNPDVNVHQSTFTSSATSSYPLCTTNAPAGGCFLDLQRAGKSCFSGAYCAGWLANETRWDMSCQWGPYDVGLSVCETDYATTFDSQTQPEPSPTASPTVGAPLPTEGLNPSTPPDPDTPPAPTESSSQNCYGAMWSWNPVDWVLVPVKCALSWAFVPKSDLGGRVDDVENKAKGRFPFSLVAPLLGLAASIPSSDCPDWNVNISYPGKDTTGGNMHTLTKNVVCQSSYTSAIRTARPVFAAMMIATALWPMIRGIVYASFPIVKPVPTR